MGLEVAHNPPVSTTQVHHLAWKRVGHHSVLPPLVPAQFRYNSSYALFPIKRCGQHLCVSHLWCPALSWGHSLSATQRLCLFLTPKHRGMYPAGEVLLDGKAEAQLSLPACGELPTGQGLVSHWSYGKLEKLGERVMNELPHLMTRKKCILGRCSHWDGLIYASVSASSKWSGASKPHDTLFSGYGLWFSPFLISSFLSLSPQTGKKRKLLNR